MSNCSSWVFRIVTVHNKTLRLSASKVISSLLALIGRVLSLPLLAGFQLYLNRNIVLLINEFRDFNSLCTWCFICCYFLSIFLMIQANRSWIRKSSAPKTIVCSSNMLKLFYLWTFCIPFPDRDCKKKVFLTIPAYTLTLCGCYMLFSKNLQTFVPPVATILIIYIAI